MSSKNTNLYDHPYLKNNINFCVSCGSKLIFRSWIEGDSSKQLCCSKTNCNYVHFLDPKLATGVITLLDNKLMLSRPFHDHRYYLKAVMGNPHTQLKHLDKLARLLNQSAKPCIGDSVPKYFIFENSSCSS